MSESIEITAENWMQFWNTEVEVCFDPNDNDWLPRILAGFEPTRAYRFIAGDSNWKYARAIAKKENIFFVSEDHREVFEALSKGGLIHNGNIGISNQWITINKLDNFTILLNPDYSKPLANQDWLKLRFK